MSPSTPRSPLLQFVRSSAFISLGAASAALGIKGFLLPNHFIDGGVTGFSMLVSELSGIHIAGLLALFNLPFLLVAYLQVGEKFALRSACAIGLLAGAVYFLPITSVTQDTLLAAAFGGVFLGAGIGLSIRGGGVLDGTEIVALLVSRRAGISVGDFILVFNIGLFLFASHFLGIEPAMYSVLTYFAASKMIDFLIHGFEEYYGVTVISSQHESIRSAIVDDLGRAVTCYKGSGGRGENDMDILFCVATRIEIPRLKAIITETDPGAFLVVHHISDVVGGMVRKPLLDRVTARG